MNVKLENVEKNIVKLEIELDTAVFEKGLTKAFTKSAKKFNVPGFRKGKAPRNVVERYYGEQVLFEEAFQEVFPEAYDKAVEENELNPVARPDIDIVQIGKGQNLIFTAMVTVKPEVELGQYKGIEVKKKEVFVTEDDVEKEILKVADKNSRLITVDDRAVQNGDTTVIDFEGFLEDVAFDGGKGENYNLVIGSGSFIPGFEEQLIGINLGEEIEVKVTFPEEYQQKELAGQPVVFKVTVKEIKVKEVPALDDEFAKDVSEFDTLEEYKADIRKKLMDTATNKAKHETEDEAMSKVVENATVDIPGVMVENRIDGIIKDFEYRLKSQGLDMTKYLEIMGRTVEDFRTEFAQRAETEVKTQLVLEKIKEVEKVEATEEEITAEIEKIAANYGQSVEDFKKNLRPDDVEYFRNTVLASKTVDLVIENAKID